MYCETMLWVYYTEIPLSWSRAHATRRREAFSSTEKNNPIVETQTLEHWFTETKDHRQRNLDTHVKSRTYTDLWLLVLESRSALLYSRAKKRERKRTQNGRQRFCRSKWQVGSGRGYWVGYIIISIHLIVCDSNIFVYKCLVELETKSLRNVFKSSNHRCPGESTVVFMTDLDFQANKYILPSSLL